jgi:hypothetical protein
LFFYLTDFKKVVALRWIPLQADAFRGQRFSLLVRKTMLTAGSSAVAFPAGVVAFHSIDCQKKQTIYAKKTFLEFNSLYF